MKRQELQLTRPLLDWLRADPKWQTAPWRTRASLAWRAFWSSINLRQSQSLLAQRKCDIQPLLILGPWRSGTTAMHELLTQALGWPTPLTWQCMNACAFPLSQPPSAGRSVARPMDGLVVNALTPQEDEFALLTLGAPSAYRAFWMPHRLAEMLPTLDQRFWLENTGWMDAWTYFLDGVLAREQTGQILLKSPNHTFRLQAIARRYPQLKVVWMLRDPAEVYASNTKMWRSMFEQHGLTTPREADLDEFLAKAIQASADALLWAVKHLSPSQFATCSQADLRDAPEACLQQIMSRLQLAQAQPLASQPQPKMQSPTRPAAPAGELPASVASALAALDHAQRVARQS